VYNNFIDVFFQVNSGLIF